MNDRGERLGDRLAVRIVLTRQTKAPTIYGTFKSGIGFYRIAYAAGWGHGNILLKGLMTFSPTRLCNVH